MHVCVCVVCVRCIRERHEQAPRQSTSTHSAVHTPTAAPSHARPHHLYARYHDKKRTCPSLSASANVLSSGKGSPSTDSIHCCTSFSARGVVHGRSIDVRESRWDGKGMDQSRSRSGHPIPNQFRSDPNIPTLGHSGPRPNTNQTRPPRHTHSARTELDIVFGARDSHRGGARRPWIEVVCCGLVGCWLLAGLFLQSRSSDDAKIERCFGFDAARAKQKSEACLYRSESFD